MRRGSTAQAFIRSSSTAAVICVLYQKCANSCSHSILAWPSVHAEKRTYIGSAEDGGPSGDGIARGEDGRLEYLGPRDAASLTVVIGVAGKYDGR